MNDIPQTSGVYLGLFADDTSMYATDQKEGYVLRNLQRDLSASETWCESWNMKINEDKTQAICFSHRLRPPEAHLTLNRRNIPFVNHEEYFCVILNKRNTWRLYMAMFEAKAFETFIRVCSLFESERSNANSKLILHKVLIISVMTNSCNAWQFEEKPSSVNSGTCETVFSPTLEILHML
jgi:hypothetical protein